MPLQMGKSAKTLGDNISEIMNSYKDKGTIGNSTPMNKSKAQKQAIAISYAMRKKSGGMG